jgi:beta-phosphoglucomutase-like phosphatase (HAD superfamily)
MGIRVSENAKGLIFDLDGTLSDSLPGHVATWNMVGEKYGFKFDPYIIVEMTGRPTIEFARRMVKQYGIPEDPAKLARMKQEAFWNMANSLKPIDEVVSIVKEYYGRLPLSVGTGASRRSAEVQLEALNLTHYFEWLVSADDVDHFKPEPHTFLECARLMGVEPQFCQVFEDGELGIEAAKNAGMIVTDVKPYINYGAWIRSD